MCTSYIKLDTFAITASKTKLCESFNINDKMKSKCFSSIRFCFVDLNDNKIIDDDIFEHATLIDDKMVYFESIPSKLFPIGNTCENRDGIYEYNAGLGNSNNDVHHSYLTLDNDSLLNIKFNAKIIDKLKNIKICIYASIISKLRITAKK